MAKTIKHTAVPKHLYENYYKKARQFYSVMEMCLQDMEWDAVLFNGVQACISVTDAVLVFQFGIRSISPNHQDTVRLLDQNFPAETEINKQAGRLSQIIDEKNKVSYEAKLYSKKEAMRFKDQVSRYFNWALSKLPS